MAMSAEHRSFNINGDVSIWVKNSWVGRKTQINKNIDSYRNCKLNSDRTCTFATILGIEDGEV